MLKIKLIKLKDLPSYRSGFLSQWKFGLIKDRTVGLHKIGWKRKRKRERESNKRMKEDEGRS